jgi:transcriptional regulator with XRE-family HTH domain
MDAPSIILDPDQSKGIKRAREMAGMDAKEIASILDIPADRLTVWERGRDRIPVGALKTLLGIYYFREKQVSEIYHKNSLESYHSDLWAQIEEID